MSADEQELGEIVREVEAGFLGQSSWTRLNGTDPTIGVLDQDRIRPVLERLGKDASAAVIDRTAHDFNGQKPAGLLLNALMGWNEEQVLKGVRHRNQLCVRAIGLLPLPGGEAKEDGLLERYLILRRFSSKAKRRGAERRANEDAAVQAGLENLARTAGYPDVKRLELAVEARLVERRIREASVTHGNYAATLDYSVPGRVSVALRKKDKLLRSAPRALKENERFARLKELSKEFDEQAKRYQRVLENGCVEQRPFSRHELEDLSRLPAVAPMLRSILWRTTGGEIGFYDLGGKNLHSLGKNGSEVETPWAGELRVAHPLDVYERGELAHWQHEVVTRRIVQPFQQVFRSLYLLTAIERACKTYSPRFASHRLHSRIAAVLLRERGWRSESGDRVECSFKEFPSAGFLAVLEWTESGHYLTALETIVTGRVSFEANEVSMGRPLGLYPLPLDEVPATVFSETLRDVDLLVSVAQSEEGTYFSAEIRAQRESLIEKLVEALGLDNVEIEGNFVKVRGKLATYRIHLASAAVHVDPGNHVCIVPARGPRQRPPYLPFADRGDPRLSEIVSKVLLLSEDHRIEDKTILEQIDSAGRGHRR